MGFDSSTFRHSSVDNHKNTVTILCMLQFLMICYFFIGMFWAIYAINKNYELHPYNPLWKNLLCLFSNWIIWPVAMILANKYVEEKDEAP